MKKLFLFCSISLIYTTAFASNNVKSINTKHVKNVTIKDVKSSEMKDNSFVKVNNLLKAKTKTLSPEGDQCRHDAMMYAMHLAMFYGFDADAVYNESSSVCPI